MTNIFAHTAPGSHYPEFLSINDKIDHLEIVARGPVQPATEDIPHDAPGLTATMRLPASEVLGLIAALQKWFIIESWRGHTH